MSSREVDHSKTEGASNRAMGPDPCFHPPQGLPSNDVGRAPSSGCGAGRTARRNGRCSARARMAGMASTRHEAVAPPMRVMRTTVTHVRNLPYRAERSVALRSEHHDAPTS